MAEEYEVPTRILEKAMQDWVKLSYEFYEKAPILNALTVVITPHTLEKEHWVTGKRVFRIQSDATGKSLRPLGDNLEPFEVSDHYIQNRTLPVHLLQQLPISNTTLKQLCERFIDPTYEHQYMPYLKYGNIDLSEAEKKVSTNYNASDHIMDAVKYSTHLKGEFRVKSDPATQFISTGEKTMLQETLDRNKKAMKTASTQVATRAVTDLAVAKIASLLPAQYTPVLNTPIGHLLVANLAAVAVDMSRNSLDHTTARTLETVTAAMGVNAMTDVLDAFDLPGLLKGVMEMPELQAIVDV